MSKNLPRIEGTQFVWGCGNGHVTDTSILGLSQSVIENETTVCACHAPNCDRVFEVSDEFEDLLNQIADEITDE